MRFTPTACLLQSLNRHTRASPLRPTAQNVVSRSNDWLSWYDDFNYYWEVNEIFVPIILTPANQRAERAGGDSVATWPKRAEAVNRHRIWWIQYSAYIHTCIQTLDVTTVHTWNTSILFVIFSNMNIFVDKQPCSRVQNHSRFYINCIWDRWP